MKIKNQQITYELLEEKENKKFPTQKWILFCRYFLDKGFKLHLYEARQTFSKYITIRDRTGKSCKVRFSNHKPILEREKNQDCDFFVGVTHFQVSTAHDVAIKVLNFFNKG